MMRSSSAWRAARVPLSSSHRSSWRRRRTRPDYRRLHQQYDRVVRIIDPAMSGNSVVASPERGATRAPASWSQIGRQVLPLSLRGGSTRRHRSRRTTGRGRRGGSTGRAGADRRGRPARDPWSARAGRAGRRGIVERSLRCRLRRAGRETGDHQRGGRCRWGRSLRCLSVAPRDLDGARVSSVGGVVTSAPEGISCPPTCEADFATGTSVVLIAGRGSVFTERTWSGAGTARGRCALSPWTLTEPSR